ncbi:hypothetical protein [Methylopila turkensis]|uniref:Uncharacterized protein n=1 Tax=Methylopila turkensis TaxID=1437816 RepID=A0A9W6JS42_9HYPH|nr:hypothetical protein [Methylopila turkensis]GLK81284.1 hypothetical protein GCM10008174_30250 [Methylopila turkensis]
MPYNVLCTLDDKASISFAPTATDALKLVQSRQDAGAIDIGVVSTDGARLPIERLEGLAKNEAPTVQASVRG